MAVQSKKRVCIIGAGPAGLVAAKTFLQQGNFEVSVYEAATRPGGMWRAHPDEDGDKCSPRMRTNLSKYTVAFSDLSWSSVDMSIDDEHPSQSSPPMFPEAWQVGRYLDAYMTRFELGPRIFCNVRVLTANFNADFESWEVAVEKVDSKIRRTKKFDYLVVASGFFNKPARPIAGLLKKNATNIQHSSSFRHLECLTSKAGKIAIIGGGISGSEAAAQAAFQISDAMTSPGATKSVHADSKIYHVINRPFYLLPRFVPATIALGPEKVNLAPTFLPVDLVLYNLSRRGDGNISAAISEVSPEKARKGHAFMRSLVGGDQRELECPGLVHNEEQTQHPGYTGITDTYYEFVRSGIIVPVKGWVNDAEQFEDDSSFEITLNQYEPWHHKLYAPSKGTSSLEGVTGIIEATGYKVELDYFDDLTKGFLCYDPSCARIPLLLSRGSILSEHPTIGFVGFYEGPYWGVMEMQARFLVNTWSTYTNPSFGYLPAHDLFKHRTTELMRIAIREGSFQIPQFWMSDYLGLVEELARELKITRDDTAFDGQAGPMFPSRYPDAKDNLEAAMVVKEVSDLIQASDKNARFVAAAVFRGMQGVWILQRIVISHNTTSPGGTFTGSAHFRPRIPTAPDYTAEYLYIEEGNFTITTGDTFLATRRYIYRYNETTEKITVWFTGEDGKTIGALFNTWDFYAPDDADHGWMAEGYHWCDPDTYKNTCEFQFRGASITKFGIAYQVDGPSKNYEHISWYERPQAQR